MSDLFNDVIMEVELENVVQIITDNACNYVMENKMLEDKHPTIF
jgi:hypothetical protein